MKQTHDLGDGPHHVTAAAKPTNPELPVLIPSTTGSHESHSPPPAQADISHHRHRLTAPLVATPARAAPLLHPYQRTLSLLSRLGACTTCTAMHIPVNSSTAGASGGDNAIGCNSPENKEGLLGHTEVPSVLSNFLYTETWF